MGVAVWGVLPCKADVSALYMNAGGLNSRVLTESSECRALCPALVSFQPFPATFCPLRSFFQPALVLPSSTVPRGLDNGGSVHEAPDPPTPPLPTNKSWIVYYYYNNPNVNLHIIFK